MPRRIKGLYQRGKWWWTTGFDCLGKQRFESCRTTNKKQARALLLKGQQEALDEGILPEPPIKPIALDDLKTRYLVFVGHQRGVKTKHYHFAHFARILGNPPIHTLTVEAVDQYRTRRLSEDVIGSTINKEISTLKNCLTKAVEWLLLRKS